MHRLRGVAQQRQIAMGGGAADQIQHAGLLQAPEARQQVAVAGAEMAGRGLELRFEIRGRLGQRRTCIGQQLAALVQPGQEAPIQFGVAQERQEGGRESEGEPGLGGWIGRRRLKHRKQRQITLLKGLEIPVLLQRTGFSGSDVGQVGVENQGQIAGGHGAPAVQGV